jgi:hypothetical protein
MIRLSQILLLLLLSELMYASSPHKGSFDLWSGDDVTSLLGDNDVTLHMNRHDKHIIHEQIIQNAPDVATIGTLLHVAGIIISNKTLENVGVLMENVGSNHSNAGSTHVHTKVISREKELPCPPNTPTK